jgi:HTH-type transcriptional regulator/antitoxin HigA
MSSEREVLAFFGITSLDEEPELSAAARKAASHPTMTPAQRAWLFRAKKLASVLHVKRYSKTALEQHVAALHALTVREEEIRQVPKVLAEMGIRLVVVEPLPRTKIDGAAFWLDAKSPVIVLSLRYDRIDGFWHTLIHELSHIRHQDGLVLDDELVGASRQVGSDDTERRADREASEFLIPPEKLESFIARVAPRFSKRRITQFANLHQIHPGIIVGQLQYRGAIKYSHSREMLVGIRSIITESALTDGWGIHPGL